MTIGGLLGHAVCTTVAVVGGRLLAARISVKTGLSSLLIGGSDATRWDPIYNLWILHALH